jgi:hypothetical protein
MLLIGALSLGCFFAVIELVLVGGACNDDKPIPPLTPGSVEMPVSANQTGVPVAAVYVTGSRGKPWEADVILAIWKDGHAVWSQDRVGGGPPYQTSEVDPQRLTAVLNKLDGAGVFRDPALNKCHYGPDSSYTVVAVVDGSRALRMGSWHELFESNPNLVAASYGVTSLDGQDREAVLRSEPKSYRHFRSMWKYVRDELAAILPREGRAAQDMRFELKHGGSQGRPR